MERLDLDIVSCVLIAILRYLPSPNNSMQPCFATVIARHDLILPRSTNHSVQRAVRAASGLAWFQGRLALVQDDTTAIVWLDAIGRVVEEQSLEFDGLVKHFDTTLGNKHLKPDLEAAVSFVWKQTEYWLALGSGSSDLRNRAVLLTAPSGPSGFVLPGQNVQLKLC
jgi:hypothetical protein